MAIRFDTAYARDACNRPVGKGYAGSVLVLPPGDVSSLLVADGPLGVAGVPYAFSGTTVIGHYYEVASFNYADLEWPYPLSAWTQQPLCFTQYEEYDCDTIVSGALNPVLSVPAEVKSLDPAWKSCGMDWGGIYDPPTSLTPVATPAGVTTANAPATTTPASPSATGQSPASQTLQSSGGTSQGISSTATPGASTLIGATVAASSVSDDPSTASDVSAPSSPSDSSKPNLVSSAATATIDSVVSSGPGPGDTDQTSDSTHSNPSDPITPTTHPPSSLSPASLIATLGSASSAVTLATGTSSGQVVAISAAGKTTLNPGDSATINSTPLSIDSAGNVAVAVSSTISIAPASAADTPQPLAVLGSNTVQADSSGGGVLVNSETLTQGQVTTLNNEGSPATISVDNENNIVIGQGTGASTTLIASGPASPASPLTVIGSDTVQANPSGSGVLVNSATLSPGQATVVTNNGVVQTVSVNSANSIVLGTGSGGSVTLATFGPTPSANVIAGQTVSQASIGNAVVIGGSTTLSAGGPGATVSNVVFSVASNGGLVVASSSTASNPAALPTNAVQVLSAAQASALAVISPSGVVVTGSTGQVFTAVDPDGNVVIGSQTIEFSSTATVPGLGAVVAGSSGLIVQGSTHPYSALRPSAAGPSEAVFTVGSETFTALAPSRGGSGITVEGVSTTFALSAGSTTAIDGHAIVVAPNGDIALGSSTLAYSAIADSTGPTQATFAANGQTLTAFAANGLSTALLDGTLLSVGGPAATFAGATVSLASSGLVVASAGQTSTAYFSSSVNAATFAVGGDAVTAIEENGPSTALVDGTTLSVGGPALTASGETITLGPAGLVIVSSGRSTTVPFIPTKLPLSSETEVEAVLTAGSETVTAFQVAGSSGVAEVDGTRISVGGSALVVGDMSISLGSDGLVEYSSGSNKTVAFSTVVESLAGLPTGLGGWSTSPASTSMNAQVTAAAAQTQTTRGAAQTSSKKSDAACIRLRPGWVDACAALACLLTALLIGALI